MKTNIALPVEPALCLLSLSVLKWDLNVWSPESGNYTSTLNKKFPCVSVNLYLLDLPFAMPSSVTLS